MMTYAETLTMTAADQVAGHLDQYGAYTSRIGNHRFLQPWMIQQAMILDGLQFDFPLTIDVIAEAQHSRQGGAS